MKSDEMSDAKTDGIPDEIRDEIRDEICEEIRDGIPDEVWGEMTDEMWDCLARSEIGRRFRDKARDDLAIESIGRQFPGAFRLAKARIVISLRERGLIDGSPPVATAQGRSVLSSRIRTAPRTDRAPGKGWEIRSSCADPRHDPPGHMVLREGQRYDHVCPRCRGVTTIYGPDQPRLESSIGA